VSTAWWRKSSSPRSAPPPRRGARKIDNRQKSVARRARALRGEGRAAFLVRFAVDEELLRSRARRDLAASGPFDAIFADVHIGDDEAPRISPSTGDLVDDKGAKAALESQRRDAKFGALMRRFEGRRRGAHRGRAQ